MKIYGFAHLIFSGATTFCRRRRHSSATTSLYSIPDIFIPTQLAPIFLHPGGPLKRRKGNASQRLAGSQQEDHDDAPTIMQFAGNLHGPLAQLYFLKEANVSNEAGPVDVGLLAHSLYLGLPGVVGTGCSSSRKRFSQTRFSKRASCTRGGGIIMLRTRSCSGVVTNMYSTYEKCCEFMWRSWD